MGRVTTNNNGALLRTRADRMGRIGRPGPSCRGPPRPAGFTGTWPPTGAPSAPEFTLLEPNDITSFGAEITTTPRNPISPTRQRRKGAVTDLDSSAEFEHDATYGLMEEFIPPFMFSKRTNDDLTVRPSAVVSDGYTVSNFPPGRQRTIEPKANATYGSSLWVAEGFGVAANNGLKVSAVDATANKLTVAGLAAEASPPAGARIRFAGLRQEGQNIQAIPAPVDGRVRLSNTALRGVNWADNVGLTPGQTLVIEARNAVSKAQLGVLIGRVESLGGSPNPYLQLQNVTVQGTVDGSSSSTLDFFFGGFVKNVPTGDSQYLDRSFTIEAVWNNLAEPGPGDEYEYSKGNYCNSFALNLAGQSLATATVGFIGTDTETPTATRVTGSATKVPAPRTNALNTTADVARLRINNLDNTGLTTDFDSMTITLNNNVSPEKVIGKLEAAYTNFGNFEVDIEADVIFSNSGVIAAVRNNTTVAMSFILNNDQGGVSFDIPAMTLGLGGRNLPRDESVTLSTTAQAFGDPVFNASLMVSFIPYMPRITVT